MACAVGLAMLATWLTRQAAGRHNAWRMGAIVVALAVSLGAVVQAAVLSNHWTPLSGQTFARVGNATASELASVDARIPADAETIVSQGVVGRFAQRHNLPPLLRHLPRWSDGAVVRGARSTSSSFRPRVSSRRRSPARWGCPHASRGGPPDSGASWRLRICLAGAQGKAFGDLPALAHRGGVVPSARFYAAWMVEVPVIDIQPLRNAGSTEAMDVAQCFMRPARRWGFSPSSVTAWTRRCGTALRRRPAGSSTSPRWRNGRSPWR